MQPAAVRAMTAGNGVEKGSGAAVSCSGLRAGLAGIQVCEPASP